MKIVTPTKVYVQKNDIAYLLRSFDDQPIPACVFEKCFFKPFICVDSNRYEFMEWDEPEAIEFFKNWHYSVDYLELQQFTDEELMKQGVKINEERNKVAERYNAMSQEERAENDSMVDVCELLEFKMYSLRDVLWFRQGHLKFKLPAGIDKKTQNKEEEKGIKKFFKRFRKED